MIMMMMIIINMEGDEKNERIKRSSFMDGKMRTRKTHSKQSHVMHKKHFFA